MAYLKHTSVIMKSHKPIGLNGHWPKESVVGLLKRLNRRGKASVYHSTLDTSGRGRGSNDAHFTISLTS